MFYRNIYHMLKYNKYCPSINGIYSKHLVNNNYRNINISV